MRSYGHPQDDSGSKPSTPQKLIWAIDDERMITELYSRCLSSDRYRLVTINDPTLVMDAFKIEQPDLILLDLNMPGVDGLTLYKYLKQNASSATIPIIVISGFLSDEACAAMDNTDYIVNKGDFDIARLTDLIDSIFGHNGSPS